MKLFRLFFAISCLATLQARAQSGSMSLPYDPRFHIELDMRLGAYHYHRGGFGANVVLEREVGRYLAIDILSADFSAPWNLDVVNVGAKTGVKGFTPRFWDDRMRGYVGAMAGYDCGIITTRIGPTVDRAGHGFAFSVGAGLQLLDRLSVGYDLIYSTSWIDKGTFGIAHYGKLGWRF